MNNYIETQVIVDAHWATKIRADWSQASSPIQYVDIFGEWSSTPYQVADFGHSAVDAAKGVAAWIASL